jgi:hypothetical protein
MIFGGGDQIREALRDQNKKLTSHDVSLTKIDKRLAILEDLNDRKKARWDFWMVKMAPALGGLAIVVTLLNQVFHVWH